MYKSHVLSFLESGVPAYYHARPSILKLVDEVQSDFLESICVSKRDALLKFNLGPLRLRRDIQMLGILHKVVLGIAPIPLHNLFKRGACDLRKFGIQSDTKSHNKQLYDPAGTKCPVLLKRSLFGLIFVYNRLPQKVVDAISVQHFQRKLLCIAKDQVDTNPNWDSVFHRM